MIFESKYFLPVFIGLLLIILTITHTALQVLLQCTHLKKMQLADKCMQYNARVLQLRYKEVGKVFNSWKGTNQDGSCATDEIANDLLMRLL